MAHGRSARYSVGVSAGRDELLLLVERLRAQIALLQAGNEVLRRTNAKLSRELAVTPQRTKSLNASAASLAVADSNG